MCLYKPVKRKFKYQKENNYLVGWKIFSTDRSIFNSQKPKGLYFLHQGNDKRILVGKWLDEIDYRLTKSQHTIEYGGLGKSYRSGFHIYVDKPNSCAEYKTIRKVYFLNPVTHGIENDGSQVVVAKNMLIIPKRGQKKCV